MKVKAVINRCYGGFSLSYKAFQRMLELEHPQALKETKQSQAKIEEYGWYPDIERTDPVLVQVVEELGEEANGECAELEVIEGEWWFTFRYYDGMESKPEIKGYFNCIY